MPKLITAPQVHLNFCQRQNLNSKNIAQNRGLCFFAEAKYFTYKQKNELMGVAVRDFRNEKLKLNRTPCKWLKKEINLDFKRN